MTKGAFNSLAYSVALHSHHAGVPRLMSGEFVQLGHTPTGQRKLILRRNHAIATHSRRQSSWVNHDHCALLDINPCSTGPSTPADRGAFTCAQ